jgi:hypothetical protein
MNGNAEISRTLRKLVTKEVIFMIAQSDGLKRRVPILLRTIRLRV